MPTATCRIDEAINMTTDKLLNVVEETKINLISLEKISLVLLRLSRARLNINYEERMREEAKVKILHLFFQYNQMSVNGIKQSLPEFSKYIPLILSDLCEDGELTFNRQNNLYSLIRSVADKGGQGDRSRILSFQQLKK